MRQGTRNMIKFHGWRVDRAVHNYVYFAFHEIYVRVFRATGMIVDTFIPNSRIGKFMFNLVYSRYHAKVLTENEITQILSLDQDIVVGPDTSRKVIPFDYATNIIIEEHDYIAVMDCPCRLAVKDSCEPKNVCLAVGRQFAEFWLEVAGKYNVRKISQQEAMEIVKDQRARGNITAAWLKVATGGRTGIICNCCSCCCAGLHGKRLAEKYTKNKPLVNYASSGYEIEINQKKCVDCGTCYEICSFDAMTKDADGARVYKAELCMGCGLCVESCEANALNLRLNEDKGLPLDLEMIRKRFGAVLRK